MKPTSLNLIPPVFFRFAPIGIVEKTRFQRNWTTFVNPAFFASWKSPPKMVEWNRPRWIRSQGYFFVSPRFGKSKKRVFNAIWRPWSMRLFVLLGTAHPKWWYEANLVEFDTKSVFLVSPLLEKSKKRVFNAIGRPSSTRPFALLGKANPKWLYETDLVEFDPKGVFSFRPDWQSRKNAISTQLDDLRQPGFLRCLEKVTQNGGMKPTSLNSIPRVFFRFALIGKLEKTHFQRNWTTFVNPAFCDAWKGPPNMVVWNRPRWNLIPKVFFRFAPIEKVEKTRFQRNWTTFVNPAICASWKSPPKMVVWNRPRWIRSQGCFIVSPRLGKSKKRVFNAIGRPSSTRLFAVLGKAHPKRWYETDLVEVDPTCVFSFRPDWDSRKNAFSTQLDDLRQPGFFRFFEKPTQNGGMKPTSLNSIPRVFFRFAPIGKVEKTRFQRNWTTFVNPAFSASWKSPPKMVLWNRPRWIGSQGCFFVSPRLGKSKKRVFNAIGRPSSTGLFRFLEKPTQNGGMKMTSLNWIPRVFFRFFPIGKVEKTRYQRNWTTFVNPAFSAS